MENNHVYKDTIVIDPAALEKYPAEEGVVELPVTIVSPTTAMGAMQQMIPRRMPNPSRRVLSQRGRMMRKGLAPRHG